jgi:flotillin
MKWKPQPRLVSQPRSLVNSITNTAPLDLFRESKLADSHAYKTKVHAEASFNAASREADATVIREQKAADAQAYKTKVAAEAAYIAAAKDAEAHLIRQAKEAEGLLIRQAKEAEGLSKMADAYAKMAQAFGGPQGLIQYMMVEKGIYGQLARANADAVRGMQPKVTVWNTGSNAGGANDGSGSDAAAAIRNTYQMLPPLMSTINEQTGITLPEWQFGKLAGHLSDKENGVKEVNGAK